MASCNDSFKKKSSFITSQEQLLDNINQGKRIEKIKGKNQQNFCRKLRGKNYSVESMPLPNI